MDARIRASVFAATLIQFPSAAQAGTVTGTPDFAVDATQSFRVSCSAPGASRYLWTVAEPAGIGITLEGGELGPFTGRDVLNALGGGVKQDVVLTCSAYDESGSLLGTHETAITGYDSVANRAPDGSPAVIVTKAQLRVFEAQTWTAPSSAWTNTLGTVDPVPLRSEEVYRHLNFTMAIESGPVIWDRTHHYLLSTDGFPAMSLCTAALSKAQGELWFLCPGIAEIPTSIGGVQGGLLTASNEGYEGSYEIGILANRTLNLPRIGMTEMEEQHVYAQIVRTWDASLGESYLRHVGVTEGGLFTASVLKRDTIIPSAPVADGFWDFDRPKRVATGTVDKTLEVALSTVIGAGLYADGNPSDYVILALFQTQGTTRTETHASSNKANGVFTVTAKEGGRAIYFLALRAPNGAIGQSVIEFEFK